MLMLTLAMDRDRTLTDLNRDLVFLEPRKIGSDRELVVLLKHFDFRGPGPETATPQ
jgi:hypothetical protein